MDPIIKRPLPNAVTYDLSSPYHVTITLPSGSTWSSGLHWHESHVEYLRIVKGRVRVRLGDTVRMISAATHDTGSSIENVKETRVDKHMRHEWSRAELNGEDVVVIERTEPTDGEKAIFFWNLNGVILDAQSRLKTRNATGFTVRPRQTLIELWLTLNLFVIFRSLDNFPVFLGLPERYHWAERIATHSVLQVAFILAYIWTIEPVDIRYTPEDIFREWQGGRKRHQKHE